MENVADVVIVSIYGRGNWLASELAGRGWKVSLVDVSEKMGEWEPEDCETPFGMFETSDLIPSQSTRLSDEGESVVLPNGMTILLPDGPIEFKGELTSHQLERREWSTKHRTRQKTEDQFYVQNHIGPLVEGYLRWNDAPEKDKRNLRRLLSVRPFEETWLAHLAHQMASTKFVENSEGLSLEWPSPLFSNFVIRQVTASSWQKGLKACQLAGVKVRAHAGVRDMRRSGRLFDAIEVQDDRSGVERGKSLVWMLSSSETAYLPGVTFSSLFPRGETKPAWYWTRFKVAIEGRFFEDLLPLHAVMIEDVFLPWSHSNLLILRKRAEGKELDVWMKVPIWARTDKGYLSALRFEVEEVLRNRFPQSSPRVIGLPPETKVSLDHLGPPRFPVYECGDWEKHHPLKAPNIFFDGPETWVTMDWLGMYRRQNKTLLRLEKLKSYWDSEKEKTLGSASV